jgi:hypothetical protein
LFFLREEPRLHAKNKRFACVTMVENAFEQIDLDNVRYKVDGGGIQNWRLDSKNKRQAMSHVSYLSSSYE